MAKSNKYHYYVMVFTSEGPKYVTNILPGHTAEWKVEDKPMEMSARYAEDVYVGLCLNLHASVLVKSRFEITHHPYNYDEYSIKFEKRPEE
jgi:hypothetical protein